MGACDQTSSTATVSFSGSYVTFSDNSPQTLTLGHAFMLSVTPEEGYELLNTVDGDCPAERSSHPYSIAPHFQAHRWRCILKAGCTKHP